MPGRPIRVTGRFGPRSTALIVVSTLWLPACGPVDTPLAPTEVAKAPAIDATTIVQSQSAGRCVNVFAEGIAALGVVTLPNGTTGFGALWFPLTLGGIAGEMASVVVNQEFTGSEGQGAVHLALEHAFRVPSGDYLLTRVVRCARQRAPIR